MIHQNENHKARATRRTPHRTAGGPERVVPLVEGAFAVNPRNGCFMPQLTGTGEVRQSCYGARMSRLPSCLSVVCGALALTACAADTVNYPSLARRDAERISGTSAVATPLAVATAPSAEVKARLPQLVERANAAHSRFAAHRGRTAELVAAASGATVASEGWSVATIALADLESARSDAMIALADLDQLFAAARIEGADSSAIADARDQVTAMVGEEDSVLASLHGRLGS
jgi:hypothetical protein